MLNQVLKVSSGTRQQSVEDTVKISDIFLDFNFHKVVQQHIADVVEIFVVYTYINPEFCCESTGKEF